jgi:hypothetical protein
VISIITAAAFLLAWFGFRYERHRRWLEDVDAAYGTLRAVHHGMVQGLTPGQAIGWGQIYFSTIYTEEAAWDRARHTRDLVLERGIDTVLVVPTEPLARLATTTPHDGLIDSTTVAVANFALWRVHAFNQLVENLADFNVLHADEITSADTTNERRQELAAAAMSLSLFVHLDGIGEAWAAHTDGSRGWYRALVEALNRNLGDLMRLRERSRWRWLREWPYLIVDALAVGGLIAVVATVAS